MQKELKKIFNACNPNLAADQGYYTDCKTARGGDVLARKVKKHLEFIEDDYLRFLFTGHIGSGKSSELLHLVDILKEHTNFLPVYVDIKDYIDFEKASLDEIFLAIAVEIADVLQTELEIRSTSNYFETKFAEIKDIFLKKREFGNAEVDLFGLVKTEIQEIKQNDEAKKKLFEAINRDNKSLLDELNLFITQATLKVLQKESQFTKLVLIVDSLEKIKKFGDKAEELDSQRELFIGNNTKLRGIEADIIYTVPLALYRSSAGPQLSQYYGECFVLPMVKVFHRGTPDRLFEEGCKAFQEVLKKRLEEIPLDKAFDEKALEFLVRYSGGNIRNLMRFIQEAVMYTDTLPIDEKVARKSIQSTVRGYASSINEKYWIKLAELDLSDNQQIDNGDPDFWAMLENLTVMEYVNGDDSDRLDDVWYAVNPVVRETGKFQTARDNLNNSEQSE